MTVNCPVKLKCFVPGELISNGNVKYKAEIVSIQAYRGLPLSFQVLIEDSYLYSNLDVSKVGVNEVNKMYNKYDVCPSYNIDVYVIERFQNRRVSYKVEDEFLEGEYILTVDFYDDNEQLHLIKNNSFVFIPNHKINFKGTKELPKFKKI